MSDVGQLWVISDCPASLEEDFRELDFQAHLQVVLHVNSVVKITQFEGGSVGCPECDRTVNVGIFTRSCSGHSLLGHAFRILMSNRVPGMDLVKGR